MMSWKSRRIAAYWSMADLEGMVRLRSSPWFAKSLKDMFESGSRPVDRQWRNMN